MRLYLYYYPAQTMHALLEVINHFAMPALDLIDIMPDLADFEESTYKAGIYTPRQHMQDVLGVVLKNLGGIVSRKSLAAGIRRSRQVPDPDGNIRDTALFETFDYNSIELAVKSVFQRIENHEEEVGLAEIDPTRFVPSGLGEARIDPQTEER
jgi:acyl-[acyl-carrier-protein] desaturase